MELHTVVGMCFTADLLFRSPRNAAAFLFIDGGRESDRRAAIRGRRDPRSHRFPQVLTERLAAGRHLCRSRFPAPSASTMASLAPVFVASGSVGAGVRGAPPDLPELPLLSFIHS